MNLRQAIFVWVCLLSSGLAGAQSDGPTVLEGAIVVLRQKPVQKELSVTAAQMKSFESAFSGYVKTIQAAIKANQATKDEAAVRKIDQQEQRKLAKTCVGLLNDPQKARLRQIWLQFLGPFSCRLPEVSKELGFTPAQNAKTMKLWKEFADKSKALVDARLKQMQKIPAPENKSDTKAMELYQTKLKEFMKLHSGADKKTMETAQKSSESKVIAIMTPAQRGKWTAMLGKKFDFVKAGIPGRG